jgi:hypothetical protein
MGLRGLAPTNLSDAIFVLVFLCAIVFHPVAWWRFRKARSSLTSGQKQKAIVGLLANFVALVLPFVYGFSLSLQLAIRWGHVLIGCWVLCSLSLVLSLLGPKQVRLPLLLGNVSVAAFWTMVPIGIL